MLMKAKALDLEDPEQELALMLGQVKEKAAPALPRAHECGSLVLELQEKEANSLHFNDHQ